MSSAGAPDFRVRRPPFRRAQLALLIVVAAALLTIQTATDANAQCANPPCPEFANSNLAASSAMFDASDRFLRSLMQHAGSRSDAWSDSRAAVRTNISAADRFSALAYGSGSQRASQATSDNPLAAYAAAAQPDPIYRAWFEGYGSRAHTGAQGTFTGDTRTNFGGIAGIGARLTPNLSVGASVDQGRSNIDIVGGRQNSRIDTTQIGLNAFYSSGPWGIGIAGIHGFGSVHSSRLETVGEATASYGTRTWGALAELSYTWSSGNWRIVPKAGTDWVHGTMDAYAESGGTTPIAGSARSSERARIYGGAELIYSNFIGSTVYDIGVYSKLYDIVSQRSDALLVSPLGGGTALVVPGVYDARIEFATGTSLSLRPASNVRLYALYDGRFRSSYDSHSGTLGVEINW